MPGTYPPTVRSHARALPSQPSGQRHHRVRRSTAMGVGACVVLLVVGAILYCAVEVDIPWQRDNTLGILLMVVGVIAIILALSTNQQRSRTKVVEERRDV